MSVVIAVIAAIAAIVFSRRLSTLQSRIERLEATRPEESLHDEVVRLRWRVSKLEAARTTASPPAAPPEPVAIVEPLVNAPIPDPVFSAPAAAVAVPETAAARPRAPSPAPPPVPAAEPDTIGSTSSAWEIVVGANWLNRLGVLALVVGIALGVGYTMGQTGPLGRVVLGYAVSGLLLGAGVWLERRATYRHYAYGLIAGGWAGTYFTAYAMHGLEAARLVESPFVATLALGGVAAGMIGHSLRYRSQAVTAFAFFVAYATLMLSPLTTFAVVATVPLSASLLLVAVPLGWFQASVLGIVATYVMFGLRSAIFFEGAAAPIAGYATLWTYWVIFEAGDMVAQWRAARAGMERSEPLFALNAAGLAATTALTGVDVDPGLAGSFMAVCALSYVASAIVRVKWLVWTARETHRGVDAIGGAAQGAIAVAAVFLVGSILMKFTAARETLGLLLVAEMLFCAGVTLRDGVIRQLGAAASIIVGVNAFDALTASGPAIEPGWPIAPPLATAAAVAVAFYANREILRARGIAAAGLEHAYTWIGSFLALNVLMGAVPDPSRGLALIAGACVSIEAGLRRDKWYRVQGYALLLIGLAIVVEHFAPIPSSAGIADAWRVLPAAVALLYAGAARLRAGSTADMTDDERQWATGAAACAATGLLALLEWRVAPPAHVAPWWASTGLAMVAIAAWRTLALLPWQGYALMLIALARVMQPLLHGSRGSAGASELVSAGGVIAALYVGSVLGRVSLRGRTGPLAEAEDAIRLATGVAASIAVVIAIARQVDPAAVTLTLGLAGLTLVAAGLPLRERMLRLCGLAIFGMGIVKLFASDLVSLQGLARIVSFVVSGLALLAVSWIYTRFRDRIRRLL